MPAFDANGQQGSIAQINISTGGVPKTPVPRAIIEQHGLQGDRQKNLKYHGGPDRAVCLWSIEIIQHLQTEGHPIAPGSTGENITIAGLRWADLKPGDYLTLGKHVTVKITDYAAPCRTIGKYFIRRRYGRISHQRHPGTSRLYAKVIDVGIVHVGDIVSVSSI